jgi:DNA-binding transcriptional MerR regulator
VLNIYSSALDYIMVSTEVRYFTTAEAARIGGFKKPMVDYLCRTGIVTPTGLARPGRGKSRLYSYGDLVLLRSISRLLQSRLPVRKLKDALEQQRQSFRTLTRGAHIGQFLITDGTEVFISDDVGKFVSLTNPGQFVFAFIVDIKDAQRHVDEQVDELLRVTT